jgi:hypothetical protein
MGIAYVIPLQMIAGFVPCMSGRNESDCQGQEEMTV